MSIDFEEFLIELGINLEPHQVEELRIRVKEEEHASFNQAYQRYITNSNQIEADIIGDDDQLQMYSDALDIKTNQETSKIWNKYKL